MFKIFNRPFKSIKFLQFYEGYKPLNKKYYTLYTFSMQMRHFAIINKISIIKVKKYFIKIIGPNYSEFFTQ